MPRKIYHDQMRHRYVRSNSYYGGLWFLPPFEGKGASKVPYAPSWRKDFKYAPLIKNGGKP